MRIYIIAVLLLGCMNSFAQQLFSGSDYIYKNQLSVGKTTAIPTNITPGLTNPAAWLEVGKDSTTRGLLLSRVVDTALIVNPVKGLFVYQIKDHTLYYRNTLRWVRLADGGTISDYVKISDSTVYYYPLKSNPKGYLTTESDPVANAKTVTINQGTGIAVTGGNSQPVGANPSFTIAATNTSSIWNANQLNSVPLGGGAPTNGQVLQYDGAQWTPQTLSSVGTVTSVGLQMPVDVFNVTGSPVTSVGTLNATLKPQLSNLFWASPNGITGAPAFRPISHDDFPLSGVSAGTYGTDSTIPIITVNNKGIVTNATTLPVKASNWTLVGDDIYNNNSGNVGVGLAAPLAKFHLNGSARLDLGSDATGDLFYRDAAGNLTRLPIGSTGQVIVPVGGVPTWGALPGTSNFYIRNQNSSAQTPASAWINGAFKADGGFHIAKDGTAPTVFSQSYFLSPLASGSGANMQLIGSGVNTGLAFFVSDNTGTNTFFNRLTIAATGNVGINEPAPAARLDVNGTFRASGDATFAANGTPAAGHIPIGTDASGNWAWGVPNTEQIAILDNISVIGPATDYLLIPAVPGKRIIVTYAVWEIRSKTGTGTQTFDLNFGTNSPDFNNVSNANSSNFSDLTTVGLYVSFLTPQVTQSISSLPVMLRVEPGATVLTTATVRVFVRYALLDV